MLSSHVESLLTSGDRVDSHDSGDRSSGGAALWCTSEVRGSTQTRMPVVAITHRCDVEWSREGMTLLCSSSFLFPSLLAPLCLRSTSPPFTPPALSLLTSRRQVSVALLLPSHREHATPTTREPNSCRLSLPSLSPLLHLTLLSQRHLHTGHTHSTPDTC